jgi:hypothetical protein
MTTSRPSGPLAALFRCTNRGLGLLMYTGALAKDYWLLQGLFLFITLAVIVFNLIATTDTPTWIHGFKRPEPMRTHPLHVGVSMFPIQVCRQPAKSADTGPLKPSQGCPRNARGGSPWNRRPAVEPSARRGTVGPRVDVACYTHLGTLAASRCALLGGDGWSGR